LPYGNVSIGGHAADALLATEVPMRKCKTTGRLLAAVMILPAGQALAAMPLPAVQQQVPEIALVPHRAVYDMSLKKAVAGSNVSDIRGRLVFDFTGSPCAGYTLTTRLVTEIIDRDGKSAVTDMRSSTWEAAAGGQFRFATSQYMNQKLAEQAAGIAARREGASAIDIVIDKPGKRKVKLDGKPMFPTQHSLAILEAAQAGRNIVQANLYDGSEQGAKLFETTTLIGAAVPPGSDKTFIPIKNAEGLEVLPSWPVTISYFEGKAPAKSDEGIPSYELSFRLYANGVSRKLVIDYGNFAIAGELSRIDFFEPSKCTGKEKREK
jgi:hypothetical protein